MANFGFAHLSVVAPYEPHWREARSAVGADALLQNAKKTESLAEAIADCTLIIGTATVNHRKPEQKVVQLPDLPPIVQSELTRGGRVAIVFGPEKHGLTREDLSWCNLLVQIPTGPRQPSMNLGQAVAVCLYELASRTHQISAFESEQTRGSSVKGSGFRPYIGPAQSSGALQAAEKLVRVVGRDFSPGTKPVESTRALAPEVCFSKCSFDNRPFSAACLAPERNLSSDDRALRPPTAPSTSLDLLATIIEETMVAARYSPRSMQAPNRHDLRLLLRRLSPTERDARRILGLFRRILWQLRQIPKGN
jgi:tRNA C32,U32 (ribose-2'-O)-methylase TrmJ